MALPPAPAGARLTPRVRVATAAVLALVVAACIALLIWMSLAGRATADGGLDLPEEREQVMSLTDQFVKRLGTYSPDMLDDSGQMPDYRDQVREVITPKFAADFEKNVPAAEQTVKEAGLARTCEVFSTGVSAIDSDSATALVAGSFTNSYPKSPGSDERVETDPAPFRVQVTLVKIKGTWLVDDFEPLTGETEPQDGATENPSEAPTVAPTEGTTP